MEKVYSYAKSVLYFMLFVNLCMQLLGKSEYKKYLRFVLGTVAILLVLSPCLDAFGDYEAATYYLERNLFKSSLSDTSGSLFLAEEERKYAVLSEYKKQLTEQIENLLSQEKLVLKQADIRLCEEEESADYGKIKEIFLIAAYRTNKDEVKIEPVRIESIGGSKYSEDKALSPMEIHIKNKLADFYNMEAANINISVQEETDG